jgi:hypothetical protein
MHPYNMKKKLIITSLFLGGGILFIYKILPLIQGKKNGYKLDLSEYEVPEFYKGKPSSIKYNKPKDKIISNRPPTRQYGESMGGQQEVGSESPMSMSNIGSYWLR